MLRAPISFGTIARRAAVSAVAVAQGPPSSRAAASGTALYDTHVPTSALQKKALALGTIATVLIDPHQTSKFAVIGETTGHDALQAIHARMLADPVGQRILREKPCVRTSTVDLDYLRALPEYTFGSAYVRFMDANGFTPDAHEVVRFVDDVELTYVMQRTHEIHDFSHVLFGVPTTVFGEVMLKRLEYIQTGLPLAAIVATFGWLKLTPAEVCLALTEFVPWAKRAGRKASLFQNVAFEDEFPTPIERLRERLGVEVAPPFPVPPRSPADSSPSGNEMQ